MDDFAGECNSVDYDRTAPLHWRWSDMMWKWAWLLWWLS